MTAVIGRPITTAPPRLLSRTATIYIAGHDGMVGSALWRQFTAAGFENLVGARSSELDLRDRGATLNFLTRTRPDVIIFAAGRGGAALTDNWQRADRFADNLHIELNVLEAARALAVPRLMFIGSAHVYPRTVVQPISENELLTTEVTPGMGPVAMAKLTGMQAVESARRDLGLSWINVIPTNLYGPGDDFSPNRSHAIAAMIRRYDEACRTGVETVVNRGTGCELRDFMHVDDMASACLHLLKNYDADGPVNIGTGNDVTIGQAAQMISDEIGFDFRTNWDAIDHHVASNGGRHAAGNRFGAYDSAPRRLLDITRLRRTGWAPSIDLRDGIADTIGWYRSHTEDLRI